MKILEPIKEGGFKDSLKNYSWKCSLISPSKDDEHQDYAYQVLNISYDIPNIQDNIRFICVSSSQDGCLEKYASDPEYVFRWVME